MTLPKPALTCDGVPFRILSKLRNNSGTVRNMILGDLPAGQMEGWWPTRRRG